MPRQRANIAVSKKKMSISLPEDQIAWLEGKVADGTFGNLSHGISRCVSEGQLKFGPPKKR